MLSKGIAGVQADSDECESNTSLAKLVVLKMHGTRDRAHAAAWEGHKQGVRLPIDHARIAR